MRFIHALACASVLAVPCSAQTTGLDFTATDCDGIEHHLFSDLEAGHAVIIDLVMMGCAPCITATTALINDVIPNTTDPAMVKLYTIGYTNSITCSQMNNWKNTNGYEHEVFAGMSSQTTYYGGMGMPTIVVLGGDEHAVYYHNLGYSSGQNAPLINAINNALAGFTGIDEAVTERVVISPNPVSDILDLGAGGWTHVKVVDTKGSVILETNLTGRHLDVRSMSNGMYVIQLQRRDGSTGHARFEKF